MNIDIPLTGGLNTQADPEEIGVNAATDLVNAVYDKPGAIQKKLGRGSTTGISANINEIRRWVAPNDTTYWIVCATGGLVYVTTNLASLGTAIIDFSSDRARALVYGNTVRFAGGVADAPKLHTYIQNRKYFWDAYDPYSSGSDFFTSDAIPSVIKETDSYTFVSAGSTASWLDTTLNHTKQYSYKITAIYDGTTESGLPDDVVADSNIIGVTGDEPVEVAIKFAEGDFNRRITGLNIYRSTDSGTYYKIISASTLGLTADPNIQVVNDAEIFAASKGFFGISPFNLLNSDTIYTPNASYVLTSIGTVSSVETVTGGFTATMGTPADYFSQDIITTDTSADIGFDFSDENDATESTDSTRYYVASNCKKYVADVSSNSYAYHNHSLDENYGTYGFQIFVLNGEGNGVKYQVSGNTTIALTDATDGGTFTGADSQTWRRYYVDEIAVANPDLSTLQIRVLIASGATVRVDYCSIWRGKGKLYSGDEVVYSSALSVGESGTQKGAFAQIAGTNPIADLTPTTGEGNLSGTWVINETWTNQSQQSTSGTGTGIKCNITVDGSGNPTFVVVNAGSGYATDDTIVFKDVLSDETATLTVVNLTAAVQGSIARVKDHTNNVLKLDQTFTAASARQLIYSPNYSWKDLGTDHQFSFIDRGAIDGAEHPSGSESIEVYYTYGVNLAGRNYVADIALNPESDNELHPDWVMFSHINQPDSIPITNYISIPDLQGGKINGLARLLGDLVVFQEKGIYRLSIPSADPLSWSLSESEPNIGNVAPDSLVEYESGVFFAGRDYIYYLNANFEAMPITQSIRDVYQAASNLQNTRLHVDIRKARLLCRIGDTVDTVYALDLNALKQGQEHWSKLDLSGSKSAHLFITDENIATHTIEAGSASYMLELDPTSPSESTSFKYTTGWIGLGDLNRSSTLRRINLRYKSGDAITLKVYTDGDSTTAKTWQDGNTSKDLAVSTSETFARVKPAIRGRNFMIEVSSASSTNTVEVDTLEVEIE